jgi:hypothetical protein
MRALGGVGRRGEGAEEGAEPAIGWLRKVERGAPGRAERTAPAGRGGEGERREATDTDEGPTGGVAPEEERMGTGHAKRERKRGRAAARERGEEEGRGERGITHAQTAVKCAYTHQT